MRPGASDPEDARWMGLAVEQARAALGTTSPNPAVGAVLVRDGQLLGLGRTQPVGGNHAEVEAIEAAGAAGHSLRGATMYITLEPCRHQGRTPPCTEAILAAGVQRVVVGVVDPFPPMRGASLRQLRAQGLAVKLGVCAEQAEDLVRGFSKAIRRQLPEVSAKVAMSLDGHIATATGQSQWISSEASRAHGHALRSEHDAILVGAGTQRADDPRLTCRTHRGNQPVPVVLDTELRTSLDARIFHHPRRPVLVCAEDAPHRVVPADLLRVPRAPGGLDLAAAMRGLVERGLHRVLVEGGARVHRSLLEAGLVDALLLYVAPVLLPGGLSWLGGPPLERLGEALRLGAPDIQRLDADLLLRYRLPTESEGECSRG